jgi:hypothetical protein
MWSFVAKNVQLFNSVIYVLIHGQGFVIIRQNVPKRKFVYFFKKLIRQDCFYNFTNLFVFDFTNNFGKKTVHPKISGARRGPVV